MGSKSGLSIVLNAVLTNFRASKCSKKRWTTLQTAGIYLHQSTVRTQSQENLYRLTMQKWRNTILIQHVAHFQDVTLSEVFFFYSSLSSVSFPVFILKARRPCWQESCDTSRAHRPKHQFHSFQLPRSIVHVI